MSPVRADFQEMPATLEADCVYVQMKKQYRVSRYIRAQWFVSQIGKTIQPKQPKQQTEVSAHLPVIVMRPPNFLSKALVDFTTGKTVFFRNFGRGVAFGT